MPGARVGWGMGSCSTDIVSVKQDESGPRDIQYNAVSTINNTGLCT